MFFVRWLQRFRRRRQAEAPPWDAEAYKCNHCTVIGRPDNDADPQPIPIRQNLPDFLYGPTEIVHEDREWIVLLVRDVPILLDRWLGGIRYPDPVPVRYRYALIVLKRKDMQPYDIIGLRKDGEAGVVFCHITRDGTRELGDGAEFLDRERFMEKAVTVVRVDCFRAQGE